MATATLTLDAEATMPRSKRTPKPDRIVLTGFMGSGKTTVGQLLAKELGWAFLDLDHEIERRDSRPVPQIFAESGEPHFRRLETAALATLLGNTNVVIALGGGAPEELGNRLLLEQTPRTAIIHLTAPFEVLVDRCRNQPNATERPNLANLEAAARRYDLRHKIYNRIATHTLDTTNLTTDETVVILLQSL